MSTEGFIPDFLQGVSTFLLSPLNQSFFQYVIFAVRGMTIYLAFHGGWLTLRHARPGPVRYFIVGALLGLALTYAVLIMADLPWWQARIIDTPITLIRDVTSIVVLLAYLRSHGSNGERRRRESRVR